MENRLNILVPMAGAGSRFAAAGYDLPKPLIDVRGKPMIQHVVDNIGLDGKYIFIVQKEHYEKYSLKYILKLIKPDCEIIIIDSLTEGAACTTLLAKELIDNDQPLLIANSDQWIDWSPEHFMSYVKRRNADGSILSFISESPKHSYSKIEDGYITEVAEKKVISNHATVGIYYWKKGSEYVRCAEEMIQKDIRHNNEFYVCPVFNEAIKDGKKVKIFNIENMWGLGTPEDLDFFLKNT